MQPPLMAELGQSFASAGGASAATNDVFSATAATAKSLGGANDTKQLEAGVKESMSLIDRFYNGGNRARPAALDILVVVLDGVVRRMRQRYATKQKALADGEAAGGRGGAEEEEEREQGWHARQVHNIMPRRRRRVVLQKQKCIFTVVFTVRPACLYCCLVPS